MSDPHHDRHHMARALRLARRGLYSTSPNPRVGCVLAHGAQVLAEGWHEYPGGPHAEQRALEAAGAAAQGASCYVTLEPCAHHGRTPPCAEALRKARISRIIAALPDPDPRTAGRGLEQLRQAGIQVHCGLLADQAAALNAGFISRHRKQRPRVTCKLATSLDGRTADAGGNSRWISSPAARADVQLLRAASCAILTGSGTALADRPRLTVRDQAIPTRGRRPLRVILDRRLRTPPDSPMLSEPGRTLIFTTHPRKPTAPALEDKGAELILLQEQNFLHAALRHLAEQEQVNELLVEAGPTLCGALLQAELTDRLILYLAPLLLGHAGTPLLQLPGLQALQKAPRPQTTDLRQVGPDLRLTLHFPPPDSTSPPPD